MNDNFADGEDVSWYYDIPFENCFRFPKEIIFSGSRALDCALRLKYAGFAGESTQTPTIAEALDHSLHHPTITRHYILSTYTATLELQSLLQKRGLKSAYHAE